MKKTAACLFMALPLILSLSGCAIGYNTALFTTKSNAGLDFDTKPPTLEVSIARREGVVAPTFENGKTPPVMASFRVEDRLSVPMFADISSTFAGGDAAATMAHLYNKRTPETNTVYDSTLRLKQKPQGRMLKRIDLQQPGTIQPFFFGTDTSFGLKVAWSGTTGQYPDTVRLGLQRKEIALAPVFGNEITPPAGQQGGETYSVKMPSFMATLDSSSRLGSITNSGTRHLQYFATGMAADGLAQQAEVRLAMHDRTDPVAASEGIERKVKALPLTPVDVSDARTPIRIAYTQIPAKKDVFDKAAASQGYQDFRNFLLNKPSVPTLEKVQAVRTELEKDGDIKAKLAEIEESRK